MGPTFKCNDELPLLALAASQINWRNPRLDGQPTEYAGLTHTNNLASGLSSHSYRHVGSVSLNRNQYATVCGEPYAMPRHKPFALHTIHLRRKTRLCCYGSSSW